MADSAGGRKPRQRPRYYRRPTEQVGHGGKLRFSAGRASGSAGDWPSVPGTTRVSSSNAVGWPSSGSAKVARVGRESGVHDLSVRASTAFTSGLWRPVARRGEVCRGWQTRAPQGNSRDGTNNRLLERPRQTGVPQATEHFRGRLQIWLPGTADGVRQLGPWRRAGGGPTGGSPRGGPRGPGHPSLSQPEVTEGCGHHDSGCEPHDGVVEELGQHLLRRLPLATLPRRGAALVTPIASGHGPRGEEAHSGLRAVDHGGQRGEEQPLRRGRGRRRRETGRVSHKSLGRPHHHHHHHGLHPLTRPLPFDRPPHRARTHPVGRHVDQEERAQQGGQRDEHEDRVGDAPRRSAGEEAPVHMARGGRE